MLSDLPLLSLLTFLPIVGMVLLAFVPRTEHKIIRGVAAGITVLQVVLAVVLWIGYQNHLPGINDPKTFQYVERYPWIHLSGLGVFGNIAIDYFMGIDGISVPMVLLAALITFIASISSFSIERSVKGYFLMFLLLDTGIMGTFCALDFFLFYVFWEMMLLPMYFLIGIWGGPRREYAAIKFFIYTLLGSVVMLLVMIGLYFSTQVYLIDPATHKALVSAVTGHPEKYHTFSILRMMDSAAYIPGSIFGGVATAWRYAGFLGLFFAFAIKIPMFPFHTWLPDAHVEAPTAISVMLAGILLKMGGYAILRICFGIFPDIAVGVAWYIAMFGVINIIYGALCAMAQKDFKRLIAYSSISHMGYVLLGMAALNSTGITGSVFQMFNHGTVTAMLFLLVGVLYDRTHTRGVLEFGGLANQMPKYFGMVVIAFFAALGLPALSSFISEAFVFLGAFQTWQTWTIVASIGLILTAGYILWTLQRMFLGPLPERWADLKDLTIRETIVLTPLAAIIIFLGVYPSPVLDLMTTSVNRLVEFLQVHAPVGVPNAISQIGH
jgi:NADH-quinone oxidoreductase subunit M